MTEKQVYLIAHCEKGYYYHRGRYFEAYEGIPEFYKIGIAEQPDRRLTNMSSGTPHELHLLTTIQTEDAEKTERLLHQYYSSYQVNGEWFRLLTNAVNSLKGLDRIDNSSLGDVVRKQAAFDLDPKIPLYVHLKKEEPVSIDHSEEVPV